MNALEFRDYSKADRNACAAIFDANCPEFFAQNERALYLDFLDRSPTGYEVCLRGGSVVGAFGVRESNGDASLIWIMIDPDAQSGGVGSSMMKRALALCRAREKRSLSIAASHKSAGFFARFGARVERTETDGWGTGMHRVDMVLPIGGPAPAGA